MISNPEFVTSISSALSEDGTIAELRFTRGNGTISHIRFPSNLAASTVTIIEQSLGQLFEQQRAMLKGEDPRVFFTIAAKKMAKIQGAAGQDGTPIVSFVLDSGLRMDFAVPQEIVRDLAEWLAGLGEYSRQPAKPMN